MQAKQFTQSLVSFALLQANNIDAKKNGRDTKAEMLRHAATMSDAAKASADREVIAVLQSRFNVRAIPAQKQAKYSGLNFEHGSAAHQALARARRLLAPTSMEEAETAIAALTMKTANSADPVATLIARFDKLTGGQKRSFLAQLHKAR